MTRIHIVDGTYELFRAFYGGAPDARAPDGSEVGAVRTFARSLLGLIREDGATHIACAFDHVVESFRNELFDGYKTGAGIDPDLWAQFPLAERVCRALGVVAWPMVEFEADDAMATAAHRWSRAKTVEQVVLCSVDKDLAQCVRGSEVVLHDRRRGILLDEDGVRGKFGVAPSAIADWLALVGDAADGIPGVGGWGKKGASVVLARYGSIDAIPPDPEDWDVAVRGKASLARALAEHRDEVELYRTLTRLRTDVPLEETLSDLRWRGADTVALQAFCEEIDDPGLLGRVPEA